MLYRFFFILSAVENLMVKRDGYIFLIMHVKKKKNFYFKFRYRFNCMDFRDPLLRCNDVSLSSFIFVINKTTKNQ